MSMIHPELKGSFLTIYPGYAQVESEYTVKLAQGENTILLDRMPNKLVQKTVKVWDLAGASRPTLGLIEYSEPNLTPDRVQRRGLNETVTVYYGGSLPHQQLPMTGILRYSQGNVAMLEVDGGKIRELRSVQGLVYESGATIGLANTPSLSITVTVPTEGEYTLKLLFLAKGFKWEPEYMWTLDEQSGTLVLDGSILITNQSGASYPNAGMSVASGDAGVEEEEDHGGFERAAAPRMFAAAASFGGAAPEVQEAEVQELGQCKFYDVPGVFDISEAGAKGTLALVKGVPFKSEYRVDYAGLWFHGMKELQQTAKRFLIVKNTTEKINRPLPGGKVTLLQVDKDGHPRRTGGGHMEDLAVGDKTEIGTGQDIDLKVTRRVVHVDPQVVQTIRATKTEPAKRRMTYHYEIEVELFNGKGKEVTVVLEEQTSKQLVFGGKHPFVSGDVADQHKAAITAPANGKAKFTYRMDYHTIENVEVQ